MTKKASIRRAVYFSYKQTMQMIWGPNGPCTEMLPVATIRRAHYTSVPIELNSSCINPYTVSSSSGSCVIFLGMYDEKQRI